MITHRFCLKSRLTTVPSPEIRFENQQPDLRIVYHNVLVLVSLIIERHRFSRTRTCFSEEATCGQKINLTGEGQRSVFLNSLPCTATGSCGLSRGIAVFRTYGVSPITGQMTVLGIFRIEDRIIKTYSQKHIGIA